MTDSASSSGPKPRSFGELPGQQAESGPDSRLHLCIRSSPDGHKYSTDRGMELYARDLSGHSRPVDLEPMERPTQQEHQLGGFPTESGKSRDTPRITEEILELLWHSCCAQHNMTTCARSWPKDSSQEYRWTPRVGSMFTWLALTMSS